MENSFFAQLESRIIKVNSLLCVGLDPHPAQLAEQTASAVAIFCANIIDSTHIYAAAYKPNIAFFEAFGSEGIDTLINVITSIPDDIPVILDAKRGDISSTAQAYVQAVFEKYNANAVTINPYLGFDAVEPFIKNPEFGAFMLCKTSNVGSSDLQDQELTNGDTVFESVAKLGRKWNKNNNLGLVVGATHPEAMAQVRIAAPDLWILAPGIGAQGGDIQASLKAGLRADGLGILVPVSRGISQAENPALAAKQLRDEINDARNQISPNPTNHQLDSVAKGLLKAGCVKFGEFTLKSGLISPIYIDLRRLAGFPKLLSQVAKAYQPILNNLKFNRIGALPYAAMPIGTALSLQGNWPMIYPRKEAKEYGTKELIEGEYEPGDRVVVIDDLTTTGGSKFEAIAKFTAADLIVEDVVVLIDRESGAKEKLAESGYTLHPVFTLTELVHHLHQLNEINDQQLKNVEEFLKN
ncbi:MAG: orotidine-5'-phosphate decarboxylase [Chloroflexi bacterium]|jgi:uridine monophosphate synthetase|nr:orotidine-5'-phosphate decarboxylase [Chloroflexota bacterium]MBT3669827.1 orotidine-5'-phosphate decarboxylase [Chloroflexota bacterium]MBT4002188.1 orotidine-5'-phosphate decarboxylase [Chloroflexota bacterium]MBT4304728.1 orotidine-5'-phosphate decarboxylase [Chloroflexota bacterium]MBT4534770.1 orotidine-5'-phosphate decarboxylase [Chloroflexota bacterium]